MEHIFIVNPKSGNKRSLDASIVIDNYCKEQNINYKMYYTSKTLDATKIANIYKSPNTILYSVGGDGTLNEIVNGMMNSNTSLVVVPTGTGNDFYKSLEKNYILDENEPCKIDVGKVNDKYFINIASVGIDAIVADLANEIKKTKVPNNMAYYLSLIKTFPTYKNININEYDTPITLFTVCNGSFYGGGINISPNSSITDGKFDIYIAKNLKKIEMIYFYINVLFGRHGSLPKVDLLIGNEIYISSCEPLTLNIDGEIDKLTNLKFSIIPEGLTVAPDILEINKVLRKEKIIK